MAAPPPYFRVDHDAPDLSALQAMSRGEATADQQKRALAWIINEGAATYQQSFVPGDTHATAFIEGRRFVGTKIVELLKISIADYIAKNARKNATPKENHGTPRRS
jgi:hypothetical protein